MHSHQMQMAFMMNLKLLSGGYSNSRIFRYLTDGDKACFKRTMRIRDGMDLSTANKRRWEFTSIRSRAPTLTTAPSSNPVTSSYSDNPLYEEIFYPVFISSLSFRPC